MREGDRRRTILEIPVRRIPGAGISRLLAVVAQWKRGITVVSQQLDLTLGDRIPDHCGPGRRTGQRSRAPVYKQKREFVPILLIAIAVDPEPSKAVDRLLIL